MSASARPDDAFESQVARIRDSGWLGRSHTLSRLFDYLAEAAREARPVREADIAHGVFERVNELSGDASVRVYIHRLRKKLNDFYAGPGAGEPHRLAVPLGEYRLVLESAAPRGQEAARGRAGEPRWAWVAAALAALATLNAAAWLVLARPSAPERELTALTRTPLWSVLDGRRPVMVVVGDYYIFGESERGFDVRRMIREFDINSEVELEQFLMENPQFRDRYVDLDTTYTPTGATIALREILPVVSRAAGDPRRVQVITSSQLTTAMLKTHDIVYVGYLSSLRLLEDPVFAAARLTVGQTYDELTDRRTGRAFASGAAMARSDQANQDLAYLRVIEGPSGNHVVVVAGTRDIGVIQAAEIASDAGAQSGLRGRASAEQLYEVTGIGRTNLNARRVALD